MNLRLPLWILWMYFGCVYGILFDGRIPARQSLAQLRSSASHPTRHHTKFTKTSTKTRKPIRLGYRRISVVPPPSPTRNFRKSTKFTKRGTGVGTGHPPLREPPRGRSLRVHPRSYCAPLPLPPGKWAGFRIVPVCRTECSIQNTAKIPASSKTRVSVHISHWARTVFTASSIPFGG